MASYERFQVPRRNFDGTTSVYCRSCGREIARRVNSQIRSVSKCAMCVLAEQGVKDAEKYVLPQYTIGLDTRTGLPIPLDAETGESLYQIFPEERPEAGQPPPMAGGIMGTVRSIFRAMGFVGNTIEEKVKESMPPSRKAAVRRKKGTLYD